MNEQRHQIVVIGGGYAGVMAALRAAGRVPAKGVSVTLVDAKPEFVERIRLHQFSAGGQLKRRPYARLLRGTGADFVQGRVLSIDLTGKRLAITGEEGQNAIAFDTLIYALGSSTDRDAVAGVREHALTLDFASVDALHARLDQLPAGGRVVVCGAGLTGIEGASEIAERRRDLRVTLIDRGMLRAALSLKGQRYLRQAFERLGVAVREQTAVHALQDGSIATSAGDEPFDLCLWAGSFAVPPLARDAGLLTDERGRVRTDAELRSLSHPDVLVAGDAAAPEGIDLRMACATAMPLGAQAGENAARLALGREPQPFRYADTLWCISLGRRDGLVQMVSPDSLPRERIITGRAAAIIKESICRFTTAGIAMERRATGSYFWRHGSAAAGSAPATTKLAEESR